MCTDIEEEEAAAFYSLLGVSSSSAEDMVLIMILLSFYSLLGVSEVPNCKWTNYRCRDLSTPFWEFPTEDQKAFQ